MRLFRAAKLPKFGRTSPRSRSILRWTLALTILALLAFILGWSSILTVKEISYTGTPQSYLSDLVAKQVTEIVPELRLGEPMARLNLPAISKGIASVPWIEKSSISRNWFTGKIKITLTTRTPVAAITSNDGQVKYLDATGFEFSEPQPFTGLAQVTLGSEAADTRLAASKFIRMMPADLLAAMRRLFVAGPDQITMKSDIDGKALTINWGSSKNAAEIPAKVQILRTLISMPENAKISTVDLTNLRAPVVK